ncbi:MAG: DUF3098 domain-containing protein [Bacteroidales bacterium]
MERNEFPFSKENYILMAISVGLIILGFILMAGPATTDAGFEPDIFSTRRIVIAPFVCFIGFVSMMFAILYKKRG